ncbi:haloacid dehalogenase-like hydrolase [Methylobacterium terricola]|uniref:phosphoserine phosphatase n=1 Tax=Methylobacterium terricola TaxID=2583531 RepID=A0A5C4LHR5_9HYPH|nr:haloacid dehalogenase-like hydrolase [Methylobacterium terricola]TNC12880.1 haloacid dehalogenase-like hydrolase [Methylobacterium terricola]
MMRSPRWLLGLAILGLIGRANAAELTHWPKEAAGQLDAMIAANANTGAYAVFDMDNTSYRNDLTEALLPYLEMKGVLTRETLDPSLKLVPFKDKDGQKESLYSYYNRLCEIDDLVCYPWIAQSFSGLTLAQLKGHLDDMMSAGKPIPTTYYDGDIVKTIDVKTPQIFRGMQELYAKLMENGIEVYIMTAAQEELVRMVASDPRYGYNVKPENVIGVTTLLKNRATGALTTSRKEIAEGRYDEAANLPLEITPYLWTPATWFAGKYAAILTYIAPWKQAVLIAGDTPKSDGTMLLHGVDTAKGGLRVWVDRKAKYRTDIETMQKKAAADQAGNGLPVTADRNWVVVKPDEIQ